MLSAHGTNTNAASWSLRHLLSVSHHGGCLHKRSVYLCPPQFSALGTLHMPRFRPYVGIRINQLSRRAGSTLVLVRRDMVYERGRVMLL